MGAEEKLKFTCNKNDCDTWAGGEIQTVATNENNKLNSGEQGQRRQRRLSIPSGRLKDLQCHHPQSFSILPPQPTTPSSRSDVSASTSNPRTRVAS